MLSGVSSSSSSSALASIIILWFALTRDGRDWKAATTASVYHQLTQYLWPEIHKWVSRLRWDKIGRPPFREAREITQLSLKLTSGAAFAMSPGKNALDTGKTMINDVMNVIGIDKQGKSVDMGLALITPETKAEQIATSYFGGSVEDDGSEASTMYGGLLEMLTWLRNTGQLQGGLKPVRKAYICTHCKAVYADEPVAQCACLPEGEKQEFAEASIVGGGVWKC
jgi:hypothetical protein